VKTTSGAQASNLQREALTPKRVSRSESLAALPQPAHARWQQQGFGLLKLDSARVHCVNTFIQRMNK